MSIPLKSPAMLNLIRQNLADLPLTHVIDGAALALEAMRQCLYELFASLPEDREFIERAIRPLIGELIKRRIELDQLGHLSAIKGHA